MDSGTFTHAAPCHEDASTEWEDIQARFGNARARPKPPPPTRVEATFDDVPARGRGDDDDDADADARPSSSSGSDLDDDDDDDEYLRACLARRAAELRACAASRGSVVETTRDAYARDVTKASADGHVVVCLTRPGCGACEKMELALDDLARKFPRTKFVKIGHRECAPNYPDGLTPTLLVYKNGDVVRTLATLAPFGGTHMTPEGVEIVLRETDPAICPTAADESAAEIEKRRAEYVAGVVARTVEAQRREREMENDDDE